MQEGWKGGWHGEGVHPGGRGKELAQDGCEMS